MTYTDYSGRPVARSAAATELAEQVKALNAIVMARGLQYEAIPWWRPAERRRVLRELGVLGEDVARLRREFAEEAGCGLALAARAISAYVPAAREVAS